MKKIIVAFCIMALSPAIVCALGSKEGDNSNFVTLKIIIPWVNEELENFLPVLEQFELENPTIKVEYQTAKPEDIATILSVQFASKKTPADVIDIAWAWYIREQGKRGHVLSLADVIRKGDFVKGAFSEVSVGSAMYGVPGVGGITVPEYRKSFFAKHKIKGSQSFKSTQAFFDEIRAKTNNKAIIASGGGVGWTFTSIVETWILTFGGRDMHTKLRTGKLAWTDASVRNIFSKELLPLIRNGYFGEPDEYEAQLKAMWNGKHAIFVGDSTDAQIVKPATDRGVFLLPNQDTVMLWNDFWFVPKYTKHPKEAKKLIAFLATKGQEIQVSRGGRIGTYLGIDSSVYPQSEKDIFSLLNTVHVVPDLDDSIGGKFQSTMWDQLALLWAKPNETTLDVVLEKLQSASEETRAKKQ